MHLKDCPAERMIPIYLIVGGSFGVVKNLSNLFQRARNKGDEDAEEKMAKTNPFDGILNCFLVAWFIAGKLLKQFTQCNYIKVVMSVSWHPLISHSLQYVRCTEWNSNAKEMRTVYYKIIIIIVPTKRKSNTKILFRVGNRTRHFCHPSPQSVTSKLLHLNVFI